jgi:hypothetical protein
MLVNNYKSYFGKFGMDAIQMIHSHDLRFYVLTTLKISFVVFWVLTLCSLVSSY